MKSICIDFEIAKQLKEKGFKQKGLFLWDKTIQNINKYDVFSSSDYDMDEIEYDPDVYVSPTAEEILKELPSKLYIEDNKYDYLTMFSNKEISTYSVLYCQKDEITDKKLCNALAKMWLYLKENNLL